MQLITKIDNPCNESWESMTPVEGGRHCGNCNRVVIDFSGMSSTEIIEYLSTKADWSRGICIQAAKYQLGEQPVLSKKTVLPPVAAATLATMLGLVSPAQSQSISIAGMEQLAQIAQKKVETLPTVEVVAKLEADCPRERGTGSFVIMSKPTKKSRVSLLQKLNPISTIKAFPNPVYKGSELSLSLKSIKDPYVLIVTDIQGKVLFIRKIHPSQGAFRFMIPATWSPATYLFHLQDQKGKGKTIRVIVK